MPTLWYHWSCGEREYLGFWASVMSAEPSYLPRHTEGEITPTWGSSSQKGKHIYNARSLTKWYCLSPLVAQSCLTLWLHGLSPTRLLCAWNSPGKHIGVGCHSFLQGIFPTQVLNLALLHCRHILSHLSHQRSLLLTKIQNIIWSCFPCFKTWESY